ncbi:MAG: family 78 glycoside hydrolase catalytic domain, partial [Terracidiphilus sp.]
PSIGAQQLNAAHLQCAYLQDPEGIDDQSPRLTWQVESVERGQRQTAYRLLVAGTAAELENQKGPVWDTGKVVSDQTAIRYAGAPLQSGQKYFWKVKVWDMNGQSSPWSNPAHWSMGLVHQADWKGHWIGAGVDEDPRNAVFGYQAQPSSQDGGQWVLVDLGSAQSIDSIVLHPAVRLVGKHTPGYRFPIRFRIESADGSSASSFGLIADKSGADFPNPGYKSVAFPTPGLRARFVRVTATRLWKEEIGTDAPFRFALGEIQVISQGKNIALGRSVEAESTVETGGWGQRFLADGKNLYDPAAGHAGDAAVLMGKSIVLNKQVKRATAYLSGLGYSELYINDKKIEDRVLDPGFTDYSRRVLYTTYDVTSALAQGRNLVGILVGNGWFHLPTPDLFGNEKAPWTAPPQALLNLVIEFTDGSRQTLATDASWKWTVTQLSYNSVRGGETIDFSRTTPALSDVDSAGSTWRPVKVVTAPAGMLRAQEEQPVRVVESIPAVSVTEPAPGVYLYNFGVNLTGWVQFKTSGKKGQTVTLQFNEQLKPDGTLDAYHEASYHTYGRFQTGEMILSGGARDTYEPKFTYHGFQYVQVTGLDKKPALGDMVARWVHTDMKQTGDFSCSNKKLNAIQAAILRTQLNYVIAFPNDPLREKMGWTQDVWNDFAAGTLNFDIGPAYREWFHDFLDSQDGDGHEPSIAPTSGWGRPITTGKPGELSDVFWGGAMVYLPWLWYQSYGDTSLIEESYPAAKRYLAYLDRHSSHFLLNWGIGDWGDSPSGGFPVHSKVPQTTTAGYYYLASIVSREAKLLGNREEAKQYDALARNIREAYNTAFFDPSVGAYIGGSQTAEALPLYLEIAMPQNRDGIGNALISSVHAANDHLRTGFMGLLPLLEELTSMGQAQLAYRIATQEDMPGWWNMIKDGGTTVTEYWDPNSGSRNLFNLAGPAGAWYYEALAGIRIDAQSPGYKHILIAPQVVGDLTWARGRTLTVHGTVECNWRIENHKLFVDVSIPANTTATVQLPLSSADFLSESGQPASTAQGVTHVAVDQGKLALEIQSGSYHFSAPY